MATLEQQITAKEMSLFKMPSMTPNKADDFEYPSLAYDNRYWLGTINEIREKVIVEYDCKTTVEKMLADQIANHYWQIMELHGALSEIGYKRLYTIGQDTLKILKEIHKTLNLAEKQLHNSVLLLKQLKQPQIKVNIKTENAYVANQQVVNH